MASQSNRGQSGQSPANLQRFLKGADYPATKDELMKLAENNGAPEEILDLFGSMPDVDFEGVTEVQECYSHIIGEMNGDEESGQSRQSQRGSSSRSEDDDLERDRRAYEERKKKRQQEQQEDDDGWDRRIKGHESKAIDDARHMRGGYDGRGRVTDEENDRRLTNNASPAIDDARHMKHGYDGRGRVRKLGDEVDETISDDRERYEERRRASQGEQPVDPETGSHSRRQKNDEGEVVRGGRETFMEWRKKMQSRQQNGKSQGRHGQQSSQEEEEERPARKSNRRPTWSEFVGKK